VPSASPTVRCEVSFVYSQYRTKIDLGKLQNFTGTLLSVLVTIQHAKRNKIFSQKVSSDTVDTV